MSLHQLGLFESASVSTPILDELPEQETQEIKTVVKSHMRRKKAGKRETDLSNLPMEVIEYNLSDNERTCPDCGDAMQKIGVDDRSELKHIPARMIHVIHRREVCKCAGCEKSAEKTPIIKADAPEPTIKGSLASPSVIAHILVQKFLMHLPLYRQEQEFSRLGVPISRQTMCNWIFAVTPMLILIYNLLKSRLIQHDIIHADDTTTQVLNEPGKSATQKSTMWVYRTGGDSDTPIAIYEYQPNRRGENVKVFLEGYSGYCHNDGYSGYHNLKNVVNVGCFAHARRKFYDAWKITKKDDTPAKIGLDYCNRLFELEREFASLTPKARHAARLKHSKPLMNELFAWAQTIFISPKTATYAAVTYLLNQRKYLENILLDGRLELSNNRAERTIKPYVLGRKNWLFNNSVDGAKASAIIYSIIETARENELIPYEYLKYLLETLPTTPLSRLDTLLPWSKDLPGFCYVPK
jgi:transposase